jgi:tetratricopeptide (TPR) repeat protein
VTRAGLAAAASLFGFELFAAVARGEGKAGAPPAVSSAPPAASAQAPATGTALPGATPPLAEAPAGPAAGGKPDSRSAAALAYQAALAAQKLGSTTPLTVAQVSDALAAAELELGAGRRDEAIGDLVYLVESPRFAPFAEMTEGRNAVFLLGDALGRAGAYEPARAYLGRLLDKSPPDVWARRAARSLVDFGLESDHPEVFLDDLKKVAPGAPEELVSDVAYLAGRSKERAGKDGEALAELAKVTPRSRFWAQATYLAGLIHVGRGRLKEGEAEFCKVADVKQTPKTALAFGGSDFFQVRDLARLGLGRVAHESFRFDDSRYYYYLVPTDSERLPEALYESANSRYEAKDYRGARELLDEMRSRGDSSPYEDEAWVFDAYVDLALCQFPRADEKLKEFLRLYEPVRDAARRTSGDDRALSDLVDSVRSGSDPASLGVRKDAGSIGALASALRKDPDYGQTTRRLAELDNQMSGLRQTMASLDDARSRITSSKEVRPRAETALGGTPAERAEKLDAQLAEVRRLLRQLKASGGHAADVQQIEVELAELESRARDASRAERTLGAEAPGGTGLPGLVGTDRERATVLYGEADTTRAALVTAQRAAAKDALVRLDRRLSRLLRRARLGRIETVLGKKRALEVEIEALSEGFLPEGAVDSLEAARYLRDDEEYWPFDGEDWADEYVGGEGLR